MKSYRKKRLALTLALVMLAGALWLTAPARERTDFTRIDPAKHQAGEILNAGVQVVIDSTWAYQALDSGEICTTAWVRTQELFLGYPTMATYVIQLDSGSVSVRFEEYYWTEMANVGHADTTCYRLRTFDGTNQWMPSAPLDSVGAWAADVPVHGGRQFRLFVTAHSDSTGFRHGIQTMRP